METTLRDLILVALIALVVMIGLLIANKLFDKGIPQYVSRKVGHALGGLGYLGLILFFNTPLWALILSVGFTLMFLIARLYRPSTFRGVGGSARPHALAELWFPIAGTFSIIIGWWILQDKWLAVVPILFMAWGDCVTGLIRSLVYNKEVKGLYGSIGMIIVCMLVALLFHPYWIAAIGAVVATVVEAKTPLSKGFWDDNHTIIVSSLAAMILLSWFTGIIPGGM